MGLLSTVAKAGKKAASGLLDMSHAARMQRAQEQGFTEKLSHTSDKVFAGSPQAKEAAQYGIPLVNEFDKKVGGIYFAPSGSLAEDIFANGPFGGAAEYLISKGKNFNAHFGSMSAQQKKELKDIIGSVVDADDVENAFDIFTDGDFYQTYGRNAQNNLLQAFANKGYDSVTFPDNLAMGDMTSSTVVFSPSRIRSINAAFDPAKRGSSDLMAGVAGTGVITGGLLQQEERKK